MVRPSRSETNRRFYSAQDIEKLNLLQSAISAGHSIGQLARLSIEELRGIGGSESSPPQPAAAAAHGMAAEHSRIVDGCLESLRALDERAFERALGRAGMALGQMGLMQNVIVPLLHRIGDRWRAGELRAGHEHLASALVRSVLGGMRDGFELPDTAARIVVTTPQGQLHEFGALLAANIAGTEGWRVLYLGPNLPAAEIAGTAIEGGAKAIALSLVYPPGDAGTAAELRKLRRLAGRMPLIFGGWSAVSYTEAIREIGGVLLEDLSKLPRELNRIRSRS